MSTPNYGTKLVLTINLSRECLRCGEVQTVREIEWSPGMLCNAYDTAIAHLGGDCSHCEDCLSVEEKEDALLAVAPVAPVPPFICSEHLSDEDIAWESDHDLDGPRAYARQGREEVIF